LKKRCTFQAGSIITFFPFLAAMSADFTATFARIADLLCHSRRTLFITGAGISADSGLPTYRGIGGLYEEKTTDDGIAIEEALSGEMLCRRPALTWKYLAQIEAACRQAGPNPAHRLIAAWEQRFPGIAVLTQNIDGLHRAAGSHNLIEIHGDLHRLVCPACGHQQRIDSFATLPQLPPPCPDCGHALRPAVTLFGEMLPEAALAHYEREVAQGFDLVFSIGTTSVFPYIAWPVADAIRRGIPSVEINPGRTSLSERVRFQLPLGAASALEGIEAAL
jgi:NAD-dependent deacetylase